jgi:4-amino-4-deoxy-L-arabinose transferase-like glycosyltransferase
MAPAGLAVLQVTAVLVLAGFTVAHFRIFGIDEGAHISYIASIAEHGRLPTLTDPTPWQVQAIGQGTYPRRSPIPAREAGLAGTSYEAFQMPLYYVLAAPAYLLGGHDFITKVRVLRSLDALLLIVTIALLGALARAIFTRRWLLPFCMALSVLMWPGVLVRLITVSYAALEFPLALAFLYACWQATTRRSGRWLVGAGALLGFSLLTSLLLVCFAPVLLVSIISYLRAHRGRRALGTVAVTIALPAAMLAPWLVMNENRYGALTGEKIVKREQRGVMDPGFRRFGFNDVKQSEWTVTRVVLPEEWWSQYAQPPRETLLRVIPIALVLLAIAAFIRGRRLVLPRAGVLLASPFVTALVALGAGVVIVQWPTLFPRYLAPEFVVLGLLAGSRLSTARSRVVTLTIAAAMTLAVAGVWVYMAGAYWYPNVGRSLGIASG